jgi:hypothetical protein
MIKDVNVTIDLQKVIGKAGLGYPLIVFSTAETANQKYAEIELDKVATTLAAETALNKFVSALQGGDNPPEKVACLGVAASTTTANLVTAIKATEENGWRQLVLLDVIEDNTKSQDAIDYIKTTADKMLFLPISLLPESYNDSANDRLVVVCGSNADDKDGAVTNIAAILGAVCGLAVGSYTYKNIIVNGGVVMSNDTYNTVIKTTPNILAILEKAGDTVVSDGKTFIGEFIDVVDSMDYVIQQIEYQTQKLLNNQRKVPYTNNGIAMLESVTVNVLKDAYNNGVIADNEDGTPAYSVNFGLRENADAEDIQARKYCDGKFGFVLAGAIHYAKINGTIKYV